MDNCNIYGPVRVETVSYVHLTPQLSPLMFFVSIMNNSLMIVIKIH